MPACEERQVGLEMKLLSSHAEESSSLTRSWMLAGGWEGGDRTS